MESELLTEYMKYRLAYLKDAKFRRSCEDGDVDNDYVKRYFDLRDYFERTWRRLMEEVTCSAFGDGPEALALLDLLRLYVPQTRAGPKGSYGSECALTHRRTGDLTILHFVSNPEQIWESLQLFERLQKGGAMEKFLNDLGKNADCNDQLVVASDLVWKLKFTWLTLNVDSFIDYNLERYVQSGCLSVLKMSDLLCQCYTKAITLTRIV